MSDSRAALEGLLIEALVPFLFLLAHGTVVPVARSQCDKLEIERHWFLWLDVPLHIQIDIPSTLDPDTVARHLLAVFVCVGSLV